MSVTGDRIKKKRNEKRLTQEQLADKVNKSKQVISNWERGYSKPIDEDLATLTKVLEVSADYLLGVDDVEKNKIEETDIERKKREIKKFIDNSDDPLEIDLTLEVVRKMLGK